MGYPAYLATNLLSDSVSISFGPDATTEDASRLYDKIQAKLYNLVVPGAGQAFLEFDFGADTRPALVAVCGHTMPSGTVVTVKAGAASDPSTTVATFTHRERYIYALTSGLPATARYWRMIFDLSGGGTFDIGQILFGDHTVLTSRFAFGHEFVIEDKDTDFETEYGVRRSQVFYQHEFFGYQFTQISDAQRDELQALHAAVSGRKFPFLWIPDITLEPCLYSRKEPIFNPVNIKVNRWRAELRIREEARGIRIATS